jgi:putative transposase
VKDVFSRMIVGGQTAGWLRSELVLDALEMAVHLRRPDPEGELIHHSDSETARLWLGPGGLTRTAIA